MSAEVTRMVALPLTEALAELLDDIDSAAARAAKADPADRSDIVRFETLSVQLELQALAAAEHGAEVLALDTATPDEFAGFLRPGAPVPADADIGIARGQVEAWLSEAQAVICVCSPLEPGQLVRPEVGAIEPPPPAERWEAPEGTYGRRAVEERFRSQFVAALSPSTDAHRHAITPSGIHNAVVTEILREHVESVDGSPRVDVTVEYRDGSSAQNAFPLRALEMVGQLPPAELTLRLALLSIRHTEMDVVADGAWLRNAEISRPRPAGQTDDIVFEISRKQLAELTQYGTRSLRLHMHQTGLETAVVGFYRAVTLHMLEHPGTLSVVPMYHQSPLRPGKNKRKGKRTDTVVKTRAPFREGTAWIA